MNINQKGLAKILKGLMASILCLAKVCDTLIHSRTKTRGSNSTHDVENHIKRIFLEYGMIDKEEK